MTIAARGRRRIRSIAAILAALAWITVAAAAHPPKDKVDGAQLSALIRQADRIAVFERPYDGSPVLFTSRERKDIDALANALQVAPDPQQHDCLCADILTVRLYRGDSELLTITNHHGLYAGISVWQQGVRVTDPDRWLQWFSDHGMPGARQEYDAQIEALKRIHVNYAKWGAAAPLHARPFLMQEPVDTKGMREAIENQFPDRRERALALFAWFGSGAGPWSGFPSNETVAEDLLLELPTLDLVAAAEGNALTEAQTEGAARLFAGWDFNQQRPGNLSLLSPALKKRLLAHSLRSDDPDKLARARQAFAR